MEHHALRLSVLDGLSIIGFEDDLAGVVVGKILEQVKLLANVTIQSIRCWLKLMYS